MNKILKDIYSEYFHLLDSHFVSEREKLMDENFKENLSKGFVDLRQINKLIIDLGYRYENNGRISFHIKRQLQELHIKVLDFWKENYERLKTVIRDETLLNCIAIPNQKYKVLKPLAGYFDTLLLEDPFVIATSNPIYNEIYEHGNYSDEKEIQRWAKGFSDYLSSHYYTNYIIEYDLDEPILLIIPNEKHGQ